MILEASRQIQTITTQILGDKEILVIHLQEVLGDLISALDLHQVEEVAEVELVPEDLEAVVARFNKCSKKFLILKYTFY